MIARGERLDRRLEGLRRVGVDPVLIRRCLLTLYRGLGPEGLASALLSIGTAGDRRFAEELVRETAWAAMAT